MLYGADAVLPHRTMFLPMPPSRQEHTLWLAECRTALVRTGYGAETELRLAADGVVPDVVGDDLPAVVEEILRP